MRRALLALVLVSACEREQAPLEPRSERPAAHTLRGAPEIELGKPVSLAAGRSATLSIDDNVRIELRGPGRYLITGEQLLAYDGLFSVDVAAQAARRPFSIATPSGELDVSFAARLVVRARGATELALISGEARANRTLPVAANTRVCLTADGPRALAEPGFATVEAALDTLDDSNACEPYRAPDPARLATELAQQLAHFTRNVAEQDALVARAREHPEQGQALVRELASRAQLTLAARTRVLALRAQLSAAQLGAAVDPARTALLTRANELENPTR